jgi:hypothetical protein
MEKYLVDSIVALEYFSKHDAQAMQYSLITKSLHTTCLDYIQQKEMTERLTRGKAASELFGLPIGPYGQFPLSGVEQVSRSGHAYSGVHEGRPGASLDARTTPAWEDFDIGAFGDLSNDASQDLFGTLNLFPMFDANGDYDLSGIT